jgi:hypothetical protein
MKSSSFTITTTKSLVIPADNINRTVYLHVLGNGVVYVGGSDLTTSNGFLTEKNAVPFQFFLPANEDLWAITASGTEDLRTLTPSLD